MMNQFPILGEQQQNAVAQMERCAETAVACAVMADHHLGYSMPIGGVCAYRGKVSPSGVGYDISCGNKAVLLDSKAEDVKSGISQLMDEIVSTISFGVGQKNKQQVDDPLFEDDPAWSIDAAAPLKELARKQLGTVGSGNHYVDIFIDERNRVWCGVHFGSRGLGHKLATYFVKAGGGKDGIDVEPVLLDETSQLGQEYIACMNLAGRYAHAARNWVCATVAEILGAEILDVVHNHHNFAWEEVHFGEKLWVVRKGATPAFPGQRGFVGGSMGDCSVILEGVDSDESKTLMYSTVHGAGRVMSRTQAAGKKRWRRVEEGKPKRLVQISEGEISRDMMNEWIGELGVELRGAGTDESPHCYKRLPDVLEAHGHTIKILHTLHPIGVAMASAQEFDPFRD